MCQKAANTRDECDLLFSSAIGDRLKKLKKNSAEIDQEILTNCLAVRVKSNEAPAILLSHDSDTMLKSAMETQKKSYTEK